MTETASSTEPALSRLVPAADVLALADELSRALDDENRDRQALAEHVLNELYLTAAGCTTCPPGCQGCSGNYSCDCECEPRHLPRPPFVEG